MPTMSTYCKAIPTTELARFQGWPAIARDGYDTTEAASKPYLFLHDSYVVTEGVFADEQVVVATPSDEWRQFCSEVLNFRPNEFNSESTSREP
jgi:hypothetical protein